MTPFISYIWISWVIADLGKIMISELTIQVPWYLNIAVVHIHSWNWQLCSQRLYSMYLFILMKAISQKHDLLSMMGKMLILGKNMKFVIDHTWSIIIIAFHQTSGEWCNFIVFNNNLWWKKQAFSVSSVVKRKTWSKEKINNYK